MRNISIPSISLLKISTAVLAFILLAAAILYIGMAPSAKAAATSNDVQYESVLDYSPTNVLINETGYVASSTYNCSIASLACTSVAANTTSLIPSALAQYPQYFLDENDYSEVVVPTYAAGASPTNTLYTISNNTLAKKTTLPTLNALITDVRYSSDGNVLLISESDGSVQKYEVSTNTLTSLTSNLPAGASYTSLSPDGRYLAYYLPAVLSTGIRTFGVIDTTLDKSYSFSETITYWDLLTEGNRLFAFSPDSTKLLYLDDRTGYQTLYEVNLADLPSDTATVHTALMGTPITTKQYMIVDMQWANNSTIVFAANRDNPMQWSLYSLNLNSYALTKITDWFSYDEPMETIGSNILFQTADANGRLTKIYNTVTKTLSSFVVPGVTDNKVGSTNQVIESDGLYGVYMKPNASAATAATSTLVVWLHGGPDRQDSIEYNSYMSYGGYDWVLDQLQTAGVPVLKLDYPGSLGYGVAFAEEVKDGIGTTDASSTMQSIESFASTHGYKKIYVMGNSYGGYLALKLLVSYPSQISGAFSLSGVTDWAALMTNDPSSIFGEDFGGAPNATNQALYDASSILDHLNNITNQKVTIVQGNADTDVPYEQSQLLDQALLAAGKTVDYTTLQGENHIYEKPSSFTLVCNKAMEMVGLPDSSLCELTN